MTKTDILIELLNEVLNLNPSNLVGTITRDFEEAGIIYCVIGGMSLSPYNYARYTDDVDLIVSKDTFKLIKKHLVGKAGYVNRPGSTKNISYQLSSGKKIPIDILIEGDKENNFIIPSPKDIRTKINGIWYVSLLKLIELKLESSRPRDLQDILNLIINNELTQKYSVNLAKQYQKKFVDLFGGLK
jgi:hypothetical protein